MLQSVIALIALGAVPGAAGGEQPSQPAIFAYRASVVKQPGIPGRPFGFGSKQGNSRTYEEEVWLNPGGGGRSATTQTRGASLNVGKRIGCNLPERLIFLMFFPAIDRCASDSRSVSTLIDLRLVKHRPVGTPGKFTALGARVDDLDGKRAVSKAVRKRARDLARVRNSIASTKARKLEAVIGMLANPLASKATRRSLIALLSKDDRFELQTGTEDPRGREATLLETDDTSHAGEVTLGDGSGRYLTFDLTDSAELRQQLYFDPRSFDILAQRTVAESTTLEELEEWLASEGPGAAIYTETYSKVREAREPRYAQRCVSCESIGVESDGVCIRVGTGGHTIVTGG